ncbi:major facilitator superfamily domain-containing protein [Thermothelomyces heterothallicus CBS 202.75]|uniref:major facilitator superfamily domain-containing protein n=1 Tax=Thermothelomyces heterothallicus CBS 202.75 TaxID=1149848 RepID=UPI00374279DF
MSDVVGRRAAFAAAYVVFVASSLACGFARSMDQLVAFRAVQGLGGSGLYSVSMIILPEVTPDRAKKYIAALVGCVIASAGVLGPVLGGLLTQYTSWRWVFWINGPVGGVSLAVFLLAWPEKKYLPALERRAWRDVDFVGAFLLIASAVLIVFPFQNSSRTPAWSSAIFLAPLLAGIFALACLFAWQAFLARHLRRRRRRQSGSRNDEIAFALPPALLGNRIYAAAVLHAALTGFPYLLCVYAFPVRFQVVYGRSALQAGLMLLPMLAASAAGTVLAGAVNGGGRKQRFLETLLAACSLMMLGCGLETTAGPSTDGAVEPKVLAFLVSVGLGFGLSAAGATMLTGAEAPVWEHASAQGIVAQVRIFGGSMGIAASSAILGAKTRSGMPGGSVPSEMLTHMASDPSALSPEQWAAIRRVYTKALREDMIVCCAVLAVAMVVTLGVYKRDRVTIEEMMKQRHREEGERRRAADNRRDQAESGGVIV